METNVSFLVGLELDERIHYLLNLKSTVVLCWNWMRVIKSHRDDLIQIY